MVWKRRNKQPETEYTTLEDSLKEAERNTNLVLSALILIQGIYFLFLWLQSKIGLYGFIDLNFTALLWACFGVNALLFIYCYQGDFRNKKLKIVLTVFTLLDAAILNFIHSEATIVYATIILISSGYISARYTVYIAVLSGVIMLGVSWCSDHFYYHLGIVDVFVCNFDEKILLQLDGWVIKNFGDYITEREYLLYVFRGRWIVYLMSLGICTGISLFISKNNYRVLKKQHEMDGRRAEADRRMAETEAELNRKRAELLESNSRLLVSQIQPHFIFNVLNIIYHLCDMDQEVAQIAVADFSDYLRTNLNALNTSETVPFSLEREHIETYVRLEQMRFGKRLNVVWDLETEDFKIPALSLQPLIENAVKHGVCRRSEGGTVTISTKEEANAFLIVVEDDGVGFDTSVVLDDSHVGLKNVRNRLDIMSQAEMNVQSKPGVGTVVTIQIPKEENDAYSGA